MRMRQWRRHATVLTERFELAVTSFSIRSSVSSRSASRGGLSQRSRLMRGNRIATPDLCRGERCQPLEGDFQHQALVRLVHDMADRAELFGGVAADEAVDLQQFLVGEAEIGFADRHQLLAVLA